MPATAPGFLIHPSGQLCVRDESHFTDDRTPTLIASVTYPDKWEPGVRLHPLPSLEDNGAASIIDNGLEKWSLCSPVIQQAQGVLPQKTLLMSIIVQIYVHMHSLSRKIIHCVQFHVEMN